jgi:hypothetical protein
LVPLILVFGPVFQLILIFIFSEEIVGWFFFLPNEIGVGKREDGLHCWVL